MEVALKNGSVARRVDGPHRQKDDGVVERALAHSDLGVLEVESGACGRARLTADREGGRIRAWVARGNDMDEAAGHVRVGTRAASAGEGPVVGVELDRESVTDDGAEGGGLDGGARGARVPGEGPRQVHKRVQEGCHLRACAGGELDEERARGVEAGPTAVDRHAVGVGGRVVAHHEVGTVAVENFFRRRARRGDGGDGAPAGGRRRMVLVKHLERDGSLIEDSREEARPALLLARIAGRDIARTDEVAFGAMDGVQVGPVDDRCKRRGLGRVLAAPHQRSVREWGGGGVAHRGAVVRQGFVEDGRPRVGRGEEFLRSARMGRYWESSPPPPSVSGRW